MAILPSRVGLAMDPSDGRRGEIKGSGEYILLECGGPEYQYLLFRDTTSHKWHVNAIRINEHLQVVLIFVTKTDHLWEAQDAAWEHCGDWRTDRRIAEHEEAQDAKEREA